MDFNYWKEYRANLREKKICIRCRKNPVNEKATCEECLKVIRRRYKK